MIFVGSTSEMGAKAVAEDYKLYYNQVHHKPKEELPMPISKILTNDANPDSPSFIYGHSQRDVGAVISIGKLENMPLRQREMFFKALVMHEFTHVCSVREGHCLNKDCIMENWNTDIVNAWQKNKANNKPPLCAECWASCSAFFAHDCKEQQKLNNYVELYKRVSNKNRGW